MQPLLKTVKLGITFNKGEANEYEALKNVSIEIFPQEYIIFFGPSGSGKSTLLYSLMGLLKPSTGKIFIKGKDYYTFREHEKNIRTARSFGMIFQQFNLLFSLNVLDNVTLPQVFISGKGKERKIKALALLKRFGIEARAKQMPSNLSGGQQQRVAVCRALMNDPDILLADEPVGNLDSESANIVMQTLKDINIKDKKTVILVTHDARYLPYADRVFFFKDAQIIREERMNKADLVQSAESGTPVGDLERMALVHPSLSVSELKAWSLSNWLIEELTMEQHERLEKVMEKLLSGKIGPHAFFEELDEPFAEGGVGLYRQTAASFTKKIVHILKEMQRYQKRSKAKVPTEHRLRAAKMLRSFLLEEHADLSKEKMANFCALIDGRIQNKISHDEFVRKLSAHAADGGAGFTSVASQRIAQRLELITAPSS